MRPEEGRDQGPAIYFVFTNGVRKKVEKEIVQIKILFVKKKASRKKFSHKPVAQDKFKISFNWDLLNTYTL